MTTFIKPRADRCGETRGHVAAIGIRLIHGEVAHGKGTAHAATSARQTRGTVRARETRIESSGQRRRDTVAQLAEHRLQRTIEQRCARNDKGQFAIEQIVQIDTAFFPPDRAVGLDQNRTPGEGADPGNFAATGAARLRLGSALARFVLELDPVTDRLARRTRLGQDRLDLERGAASGRRRRVRFSRRGGLGGRRFLCDLI